MVHAEVWADDPADPGATAVFVHGSQSWGSDEIGGFAAQRPLAARVRMVVIDRRGYGQSPDPAGDGRRSGHTNDADDVIGLLGTGAHLVGHSYGAVVTLLAAAGRPDLVRSLTLIEPVAYALADEDPAVARALARQRAGVAGLPADLSPAHFLRASYATAGLPVPAATPQRLRAAARAMRELHGAHAVFSLDPVATAAWPKLVISGDWTTAPAQYRAYSGDAMMACARVIAGKIGARVLRVPGASHWPHAQQPRIVNDALSDLWGTVSG
jgi:pimeloyl-ACP methyl ester carboxylesterase